MSAQPVKKTVAASAPVAAIKPAGVAAIAPDSDKRISYWRDQTEDFLTELSKLRCLSGLLNGQNEQHNINLAQLCYLIDPSIDRLKEICDGIAEVFNQKQVAFLQVPDERSSSTDAA